jgi:hypothetical protein
MGGAEGVPEVPRARPLVTPSALCRSATKSCTPFLYPLSRGGHAHLCEVGGGRGRNELHPSGEKGCRHCGRTPRRRPLRGRPTIPPSVETGPSRINCQVAFVSARRSLSEAVRDSHLRFGRGWQPSSSTPSIWVVGRAQKPAHQRLILGIATNWALSTLPACRSLRLTCAGLDGRPILDATRTNYADPAGLVDVRPFPSAT